MPTPPTDEELERAIAQMGGWRYRLARVLHYPCYFALIGAQVVRRRWREWWGR